MHAEPGKFDCARGEGNSIILTRLLLGEGGGHRFAPVLAYAIGVNVAEMTTHESAQVTAMRISSPE